MTNVTETSNRIYSEPLAPTRARSKSISISIKTIKCSDENLLQDLQKNIVDLMATQIVNGSWTREEDEKVIAWVKEHGATSWTKLAETLPGRIGKQCRERWHNSLDPNLVKSSWKPEEDELIIQKQKELGNKWSKIAEFLPGRTDNAVKNRWNSSIKRRLASFGENSLVLRSKVEKSQKVQTNDSPTNINQLSEMISHESEPNGNDFLEMPQFIDSNFLNETELDVNFNLLGDFGYFPEF